MFIIRYLYFTTTSLKIKPGPLVYMSPRGLISILLFIQLKDIEFINLNQTPIDERVLLIVILSSMLVMLLSTMKKQKVYEEIEINDEEPLSVEMDINIPPSSSEETKNL